MANTNGVTIEVNGSTYHSFNDFGLIITNTDYIGAPVLETNYITIPGRSGLIDISELIADRPVYSYRPISVAFAGSRTKEQWDVVISQFRNLLNGKIVKLTFDNDLGYFWQGRAQIDDSTSINRLGTFRLNIPYADPYKWATQAYGEPWLWDSFSFVDGEITTTNDITVEANSTKYITLPKSDAPIVPVFTMTQGTGGYLDITYNGKRNQISELNVEKYFPDFAVYDNYGYTLKLQAVTTGDVIVHIDYRKGSL